jgi:hypothetical protein
VRRASTPRSSRTAASNVAGGCRCGAVRYRADGPATHPTLCHCASCRRAAGAPVVAWVTFPAATFAFDRGEPVRFRSSPAVERTFCGRCGTALTYRHRDFAAEVDVTTASLDDPAAFPPADHTWVSERLPWLDPRDTLPRFARSRSEA